MGRMWRYLNFLYWKKHKLAKLPSEKEHVTPYMFNSKKGSKQEKNIKQNYSNYRFCIDYLDDFKLYKNIRQF